AGGTGWTCSNVGQVVTCDTVSLQDLTYTRAFPPLSINVTVDSDATSPLVNSAVVSNPTTTTLVYNVCETEDNGVCPNSATNTTGDETVVVRSDLSTSTKSVVDLNGGDAEPGDALRYTITIKETGGAAVSGVSVTDMLPANTSGYSIVSIPAGSTNASTGSQIVVEGIALAANGTATIVFDAIVATVSAGAAIDNTAVITNPGGTGASPAAPQVIVSESKIAVPGAGEKILYLRDDDTMTRAQTPTGSATAGRSVGNGSTRDWRL